MMRFCRLLVIVVVSLSACTNLDPARREIVISAHEMDREFSSTPPARETLGLTPAWTFYNQSRLNLVTRVPNDWDEESRFEVTLIWSSPATSGDVLWNATTKATKLGESVDDSPGMGSGFSGTASIISGGLSSSRFYIGADRLERGDLLSLSIVKASDTIDGDIHLYQVVLSYMPVAESKVTEEP